MHWQITALWGGKKVELRETQRAVTPFGGLVVFLEFLRQVGYREAVSKYLPFRLTSPNAIDPVETFTAFLLSVVAGARRFAAIQLNDYFEFLVGEAREDLDGAPEGGSRYPVDARMDGREFARFHVDVGIGDEVLEPLDVVKGRDWLGLAE